MRRFTSLRCASVARRWLALACLLAAPLAGAAEVPAAAPARIDIGVLTVLDGEDTQRLWQPLADGLARTLISPAELPVGVMTSLVGAPCFLWLLRPR